MEFTFIGVSDADSSMMQELLSKNPSQKIVGSLPSDSIAFLGCGIALTVNKAVKKTDLDSSSSEQD